MQIRTLTELKKDYLMSVVRENVKAKEWMPAISYDNERPTLQGFLKYVREVSADTHAPTIIHKERVLFTKVCPTPIAENLCELH